LKSCLESENLNWENSLNTKRTTVVVAALRPVRTSLASIAPASLLCLVTALAAAFAACPAQAGPVLLVANGGNNTVGAYNAVTGVTINSAFVGTGQGLSGPESLRLDSNNHLFVASQNDDTVGQYNATTGATINANFIVGGVPLGGPAVLALDGNNHILFQGFQFSFVGQYNATTGALVNGNFINSGAGAVEGVALDGHNHIFVATGTHTVGEYDATTGATINASFITLPQPGIPRNIAIDALNHLFVAQPNTAGDTVGEYDATTGATINATFINGQGLNVPWGLALDGNNHLFVSSLGGNAIGEYDATTGATINATLVTGLNGPTGLLFVAPVPEPSTFVLVGIGFLSLLACIRQRRRRM
jgi:PEP-CTERM motif